MRDSDALDQVDKEAPEEGCGYWLRVNVEAGEGRLICTGAGKN